MITVAFDVDGCLLSATDDDRHGPVAQENIRSLLIAFKQLGCRVVIWSGRGQLQARQAARHIHVLHYADLVTMKGDERVTPDIEKIIEEGRRRPEDDRPRPPRAVSIDPHPDFVSKLPADASSAAKVLEALPDTLARLEAANRVTECDDP